MYINTSTTSSWTSAATASHASSSSPAAASQKSAAAGDSVSISQAARNMASGKAAAIQPMQKSGIYSLATNNGVAATNQGLRKYLNIGVGGGATNLTAMNFSRKQLSGRIDQALKTAGIELKEDEKLAISVNSKNEIVVGGIKDKAKAKKIQDALNEDTKLATEMRNHVAAGKINENAAKQEAYQTFLRDTGQPEPENIDELFTSPGLRNYVINEYLNEHAGLGLGDLRLEYDEDGNQSIAGCGEPLQALLAEDQQLGATIGKILENGETAADFDVSFEFANGAVSDGHSKKMADDKIKGITEQLFARMEDFRETIGKVGDEEEIGAFAKALERGFSINVKANGEFEIAGLENIDPKYRDSLKNLLEKAMDDWAAGPTNAYDGGGQRVANFADVYDAFIEEHKFEHGDVDEFPHELEINFAAMGQTRVVSPEADKAQHEENEKLAAEVGEALRKDMEKEGIDTSGLTMEVDEKGRITVNGDLAEADLKRAQAFVDNFMQGAKTAGVAGEDEEDDKAAAREAEKERRAMHFGEEEKTNAVSGEKSAAAGDEEKPEVDEKSLSPRELRQFRMNEAWEKSFPKNHTGGFYLGVPERSVSGVKPSRYQDTGDSDAANLYRRLLNGMDKFHDKPKAFSYAM